MMLNLTAHPYEVVDGNVQTVLFGIKGRLKVEVATFEEAQTKIEEFGKAHSPCNVWVGFEGRKPKGHATFAPANTPVNLY